MTFEVVSPVSWTILGLSPWTWVLFLPPGPCLPNPESVYNRRGPHVYTKTVFACILDCLTLINFCVTWTVSRPLLWSIRYQNTVIFPWQGHIKDRLGTISRKQCVFDVENQNPWVKWHSKWFLLYLGHYWGYSPEPGSCFYLQDIFFPISSLHKTGGACLFMHTAFACIPECLTLHTSTPGETKAPPPWTNSPLL